MGVTLKRDGITVYLGKIKEVAEFPPVYPKERDDEIRNAQNIKVKKQKYFVWKLLEHAIKDTFGLDIKDLKIEKKDSGKWVCDKCYFSLSHSEDIVAVALSNSEVGVDIERIRPIKENAIIKTLTDSEKEQLSKITPSAKQRFLLEKWSQKESIFKFSNQENFLPSKIDTSKASVLSKFVILDNKELVLSIASENIWDIDIKEI
jgi:phosphopantetheine--protein transferase-like protein